MTEEYASVHTYELDADRWITVEVDRRWPKFVAAWSIRRRSGDSDYPVVSGEVERMPPDNPEEISAMLDELRGEARSAALAALPGESAQPAERKGLLSRLFGR